MLGQEFAQQSGEVLHDDESRSEYANGVGDGCPQAAVDAGDADAFAGVEDVLVAPSSG
jgi:hypothetical protein